MNVALLKVIKTSRVNRVLKQKRKAENLTLTSLSSRLNANNMGTCALGNFSLLCKFCREGNEKPRREKETIARDSAFLM